MYRSSSFALSSEAQVQECNSSMQIQGDFFFSITSLGGKKSLKEQKVYIDRMRTFAFRFDRVIYRSFVELG